jgi:hypothetical protein
VRARDERRGVDALRVLGVAREGGVRGRGGGRERLRVPEPLGLGRQLDVLARPGLHRRDLVEPEAQHVGFLGPFTSARGDLVQLGGDATQPPVRARVLGERHGDRVARVPVEGLPLPGQLEQPLLVRLAVHGHELVRELGEQPHGHGTPAQVCARASLGGNGTADQQRPVVELGPGLLGPYDGRGAVGYGYPPLHDRVLGPDPHEGRVGAAAQQQAQAGDHHRLARAGLAGHGGEAG